MADAIAEAARPIFGRELPVRLHCWDGSVTGSTRGPVVHLRSPEALRHIVWSPGELGFARAYVTGVLDLEGDLADSLALSFEEARRAREALGGLRRSPRTWAKIVSTLARLGALRPPPQPPRSEARISGRLHSRRRDAQVISHHYDISNDFYRLLLDPNMAYSCAYWTDERPGYGLYEAQTDKLDLVCRKLNLRPGVRLLDLGCGWGSLTLHAAKRFGASVVAVTVSKEQADFVARRVEHQGVAHLVDLRRCDYRDVIETSPAGIYDAVANIEMGEHVGEAGYLQFLTHLHSMLKEEGRLLIQVMSRKERNPGGGPFIERYIAPDMHMRPLHAQLGLVAKAGFEVRDVQALREHYGRTIRAWLATLDSRWEEAVALIGLERARVWRLYLAGGALSFEANRMGVDQILAVKPAASGASGMPPTRLGWDQPAEVIRTSG